MQEPLLAHEERPPISLYFDVREVSVDVPPPPLERLRGRPPTPKTLLSGVRGHLRAGEFLAILGGSGSGKTTLLDTLSGRVEARVDGDVLFNGHAFAPARLSAFSGYVEQSDSLLPMLTVRETLAYVARLRLPRALSGAAKLARVDAVIADLGLRGCVHTRIGGGVVRGVSGGERRRVSVAVQLLMDPSLLFLDEPTTGLDASAAKTTVEMLRSLASEGMRTVVLTIHQPRSDLFPLFDHVMLLSMGRTAYLGPAEKLLGYFAARGHEMPPYSNPLDWAVDLVAVDHTSEANEASSTERIQRLVGAFSESLAPAAPPAPGVPPATDEVAAASRPGPLEQFRWLLHRNLVCQARDWKNLCSVAAEFCLVGITIGTIFLDLGDDVVGMQDRFSLSYIGVALLPFHVILSAVASVCNQRPMFYRERRDGLYSWFPYYAARLLAEAPMYVVFTVLYGTAIYWPPGLQPALSKFLVFLLVVWLVVQCSLGIALAVSSALVDFQQASFAANLTFTLVLLPCGFLFNLESLYPASRWVSGISYLRYGLEGMIYNELEGEEFCPVATQPCPLPLISGNVGLEQFDVGTLGVAKSCAALVAIIAVLQAGAMAATCWVSQKPAGRRS